MITDQQRYELKKQFGNVYSTTLGGIEYVFRPLTIEEYEYILEIIGESGIDADLEDYAVRFSVVDPPNVNLDKMKAGHVTALADEILRISGFVEIDYLVELLTSHRASMEKATAMMKAIVIAAMPSYTDEDLNSLTMDKLLEKLALAEKIISVQQAASGLPSDMSVLFAFDGQPIPEQQVQVQPEQKREPISKEKLLSKIANTERETSGKGVSREILSQFDEETLLKMSGVPQGRDPIAERLKQALY